MDKYTKLSPEMQASLKNKMDELEKYYKLYDKDSINESILIHGLQRTINALKFQTMWDEICNYKPSITSLKSQLKHCKNYLERQNIERELNRLYKERR